MTIRKGVTKWLLRHVLDRYVPRQLIDLPKIGFGIPHFERDRHRGAVHLLQNVFQRYVSVSKNCIRT